MTTSNKTLTIFYIDIKFIKIEDSNFPVEDWSSFDDYLKTMLEPIQRVYSLNIKVKDINPIKLNELKGEYKYSVNINSNFLRNIKKNREFLIGNTRLFMTIGMIRYFSTHSIINPIVQDPLHGLSLTLETKTNLSMNHRIPEICDICEIKEKTYFHICKEMKIFMIYCESCLEDHKKQNHCNKEKRKNISNDQDNINIKEHEDQDKIIVANVLKDMLLLSPPSKKSKHSPKN